MTWRPRDQLLWSGFRLSSGVQAVLLREPSVVKPDRWQSENCGKVLSNISGAINVCRQPVAMVLVPKLLAVCPPLVLVLFGYCGRINGQGENSELPGDLWYSDTKSPLTASQKPERLRFLRKTNTDVYYRIILK